MKRNGYSMIGTATLYIGAVVGAGFATGREIMVFFAGQSVLAPIAAGFGLGLMCVLFLEYGKASRIPSSKLFRALDKGTDAMLWLSACMTFLCMASAAEELTFACTGVKYLGFMTALACALAGSGNMRVIGRLNVILVPLICISTVWLACYVPSVPKGGVSVGKIAEYCCMNVMLGGYVVTPAAGEASKKQIWGTGGIVGAVFALLLGCVYGVAAAYPDAAMPVFEFAAARGLMWASGILIYFSIVTTMISAGGMIGGKLKTIFGKSAVCIAFLAALAIIGCRMNFTRAVSGLYPLVGCAGIGYVLYALAKTTRGRVKRDRNSSCDLPVSERTRRRNTSKPLRRTE